MISLILLEAAITRCFVYQSTETFLKQELWFAKIPFKNQIWVWEFSVAFSHGLWCSVSEEKDYEFTSMGFCHSSLSFAQCNDNNLHLWPSLMWNFENCSMSSNVLLESHSYITTLHAWPFWHVHAVSFKLSFDLLQGQIFCLYQGQQL